MNNLNSPIATCGLSSSELALLEKGNFNQVQDLVLTPLPDIAKRCRVSQLEVKRIVDKALRSLPQLTPKRLDRLQSQDIFTTGDDILDEALRGGIRTGMVWEVVGESAAGKTQLALQLSLFVQADRSLRGLSGSTCYLTTSSKLPTNRLLQIAEANGIVAAGCGLEDIHTLSAPTVAVLEHVLQTTLPNFIEQTRSKPGKKPVRLLVIDALGELFHLNGNTSTSTLIERSKNITNISTCLHRLATQHHLAVVVLNEVMDVIPRSRADQDKQGGMFYDAQSKWFNTATFFGDASKEATLGLAWANQVNARIMLTLTGRRRYLSEDEFPRRKPFQTESATPPQADQSESTLIRRLSVLFSSVSEPVALDYIVTISGISTLPNSAISATSRAPISSNPAENQESLNGKEKIHLEDLDSTDPTPLGDEFDDVWDHDPIFENFDWDTLEENLSQQQL